MVGLFSAINLVERHPARRGNGWDRGTLATFQSIPTVCDNGHAIVYYSDSGGMDNLWKVDPQNGNGTKIPHTMGASTRSVAYPDLRNGIANLWS